MSVMISKDGNNAVVDCSCGCSEGLKIRVDKFDEDNYFLVSYTNGSFYRDQNESIWHVIGKKLKKIWCIIRNKDYCYSEICMTKTDFEEFKKFLLSIE